MKEKYKLCNFERNTIKMQRKVNKRRGKRNTIKRTVRSVQNNKIKKNRINEIFNIKYYKNKSLLMFT